eukprot:CAMPEP_0168825920 /NCGR_PEP_ID=MMETSP0726-20121227/11891_1 /TAXON_ID=265536 /ORGANISM="Amphiprora sp., Strain CCMP467" /LENGTH=57 /DNA_ID=CAMNT_0008879033 /DNA_START=114 /DNA_END=283 /DNA_ORIENTATION=-
MIIRILVMESRYEDSMDSCFGVAFPLRVLLSLTVTVFEESASSKSTSVMYRKMSPTV